MSVETQCVYCGISHQQAPLVKLVYQGAELAICTTHLPVLIHEPAKIAEALAKAAKTS